MSDLKTLFSAEGRFAAPTAFRAALAGAYGDEWLTWAPETLWLHIEEEAGIIPNADACNKVNALRLLLTSNGFWEQFMVFEKTVLAFNGRYVDPEVIQVCLPEEIGYGVACASRMRAKRFQAEVIQYIRGCFSQVGMLLYPKTLEFAQPQYNGEMQLLVEAARDRWDIEMLGQLRIPAGHEHDPIWAQIGQLHDVEAYIAERLAKGEPADHAAGQVR